MKQLDDGLFPEKEVAIEKTLVNCSCMLKTLQYIIWVLAINMESQT